MPSKSAKLLSVCGLMLLFSHCTRRVAVVVAPPLLRDSRPIVSSPLTSNAVLLPRWSSPTIYRQSDTSVVYFTTDGLRGEFHDQTVTLASDRFAGRLQVVTRLSNGWLFMDSFGTVGLSDTFTGPLREFPSISVPFNQLRLSYSRTLGRAVLLDQDGIWSTDGSVPFVRSVPFAGVPVSAVSFADPLRGVALLETGEVRYTSDGAVHWSAVDFGAHSALGLSNDHGHFVFHTTNGYWSLNLDGTRIDPAQERVEDRVNPLAEQSVDLTRLQTELAKAYTRANFATLANTEARLPSGERVFSVGGLVYQIGQSDGNFTLSPTLSLSDSGNCQITNWGSTSALLCVNGVATLQDQSWHVEFTSQPTEWVLSNDGIHAVSAGRCLNEHARVLSIGPNRHICFRARDNEEFVEKQLPTAVHQVLAMRGTRVIVVTGTRTSPELQIVDQDSATVQNITLASIDGQPNAGLVLQSARFLPNGNLWGIATSRSPSERWLATGPIGTPLRVQALPVGAVAVGFADADRGVAVGEYTDQLWRTLDGGAHWSSVTLSAMWQGRRTNTRLHERSIYLSDTEEVPANRATFACISTGCWVTPYLWVGFEDSRVAPTNTRILGSRQEDLPPGPLVESNRYTDLIYRFHWRYRLAVRSIGRELNAVQDAIPESIASSFVAVTARSFPDHRANHVGLTWRGADRTGLFNGSVADVVFPEPDPNSYTHPGVLRALAAGRGGLLLWECLGPVVPPAVPTNCGLYWVPNQGTPQRVNSEHVRHIARRFWQLTAAMPMPDGGVAVVLSDENAAHGIVVSATGALRTEVSFALINRNMVTLGRVQNSVYLLLGYAPGRDWISRPLVVAPADGPQPHWPDLSSERTLEACPVGMDQTSELQVIATTGFELQTSPNRGDGQLSSAIMTVGASTPEGCLLGIQGSFSRRRRDGSWLNDQGTIRLTLSGNEFSGTLDTGTRIIPLRQSEREAW